MRTLEEQDSMARHEIGGNPELNVFKNAPTSAYIKLPSKNDSADIKLPSINNGVKNFNIRKKEDEKRMKSSTLSGKGDEIATAGSLLSTSSKATMVGAGVATKSAASSKDTTNSSKTSKSAASPKNNSKVITIRARVATKSTASSKDTSSPTSG